MDPGFVEFPQTTRGRISPYLGFIPILNVLLMFRLNEAVRGRWIGPKTWDQIIGNIFFAMEQPVTMGMSCLGVGCVDCVLNGCLVCIGPGWPWIAGSQGEPLICDFSGIVTEGFTIPETVF